ncbi:MAG: hypothetical protein ACI87W_001573 [Halieaceae bacterium]|jgi:hypothetical protein
MRFQRLFLCAADELGQLAQAKLPLQVSELDE